MARYDIKEIEKAMAFLRKECAAESVEFQADHHQTLFISAVTIGGEGITIKIFDKETSKFAIVVKEERLK